MSPSKARPLPLKQRTSSVDTRRDYSSETWFSVLGLVKVREFLVTVDHFSIWRRHLAWAIADGKDLRDYMTQRYAASMIFMSLLLSTELNVLFNSAGVTTSMRHALMQEQHNTISFWAGIFILMSAVLTLLSLITIFTAWTMVSAVSATNAHCIFRSSLGQYVAELPGRFIVGSIYTFMIWLTLFIFLLLPFGFWSCLLLVVVVALFVHTITAFSAFGRLIMHTGAMGPQCIFESRYEASLLPHTLHSNLLVKARANLANKTSIISQYRQAPIDRPFLTEDLTDRFSEKSVDRFDVQVLGGSTTSASEAIPPLSSTAAPPPRKRTESLVKFADGFDTNGERVALPQKNQTTGESTPLISVMSSKDSNKVTNRPPRPVVAVDERLPRVVARTDHKVEPDILNRWLTAPSSEANDVGLVGEEIEMDPLEAETEPDPSFSAIPSVGSSSFDSKLTEEEKFDLEYGEFLEPSVDSRHETESDDGVGEEWPLLNGVVEESYHSFRGGFSES